VDAGREGGEAVTEAGQTEAASTESAPAEVARGRRPSTTRAQIARVALGLFERNGFDETTVEDIADAVGISRRTLFRYFESKRDIVWGEFAVELVRLRQHLHDAPADEPLMDVLRRAVVSTNRFGAGELDELRIRVNLISTVPTLVAHSALRYAEWRQVVAEFASERRGEGPDDLGPQTLAHAALGAAMAAFARWAHHDVEDLSVEVDRALRLLATGFRG
jgi:mycofactocin system transcriptional regulator